MKPLLFAAALAAVFGCSSSDAKPWPDLHPAKGSVKVEGKVPAAGYVSLRSDQHPDMIVGGKVEPDGTFKLQTSHALEKNSSQKPGAPAGKYSAKFMPAGLGDQVTGKSVDQLVSFKDVVVAAGENDLAIEFQKPKK